MILVQRKYIFHLIYNSVLIVYSGTQASLAISMLHTENGWMDNRLLYIVVYIMIYNIVYAV